MTREDVDQYLRILSTLGFGIPVEEANRIHWQWQRYLQYRGSTFRFPIPYVRDHVEDKPTAEDLYCAPILLGYIERAANGLVITTQGKALLYRDRQEVELLLGLTIRRLLSEVHDDPPQF